MATKFSAVVKAGIKIFARFLSVTIAFSCCALSLCSIFPRSFCKLAQAVEMIDILQILLQDSVSSENEGYSPDLAAS